MTEIVAALSYLAIGRGAARRLGLPLRGAEGFAIAAGLGTGLGSLAVFAMVCAHVLFFPPIASLVVLAVLVAALTRVGMPALPRLARPPLDRWALPPMAFGLLLLLAALAPETGWDALAYHLPAAERARREGLGPMVGCLDGEFRLGFDLLWVPCLRNWPLEGFPIQGPAFLHALAGVALGAGLFAEARRRAGSMAAGVVTTLFLAGPGVADLSGTAYVDLGVALHTFLAVAAAARALRGESGRNVLAAGMFAGFAANDKLNALLVVPLVGIVLFAGRRARAGWRPALVATGVGLLVTLPWIARAWVDMGNPAFPALVGVFGGGWADPGAVRAATAYVLGQTGLERTPWLPLSGTVHAVLDPAWGFTGPAWIVALLPAACVRPTTPERRGLLAAGAGLFLAWGFVVPHVRFGLGLWAWGAVAAAVGAARLVRGRPRLGRAVVAGAVVLLALDVRAAERTEGRLTTLFSSQAAEAWVRAAWRAQDGLLEGFDPYEDGSGTGVAQGPARLAGPLAVSMEPLRNGVIDPAKEGDPDALLAACRRLEVRRVLFPTGSDRSGVWPRVTAAWQAAGLGEVVEWPRPRPLGEPAAATTTWRAFEFSHP